MQAMRCWVLAVAMPLSCASSVLAAANFTVGTTPDCTHSSIAAAIAAAAANGTEVDYIRINSGSYNAQALQISGQSLTLTGGYASCADVTPGAVPTTISGVGNGGAPLLIVNAQGGAQRQIGLINLTLTGATAGALRVLGYVQMSVAGVTIANSSAVQGGGVYVKGDSASAIAHVHLSGYQNGPGRVEGNTASQGGGIYVDDFSFVPISDVVVSGNAASFGAGIFATGSNAQIGLTMFDGGSPLAGVRNNTASVDGGGIYLQSGADLSSGKFSDASYAPNVSNNSAGRNGGGMYLANGGSAVLGYYLMITGNSAAASQTGGGGGLYIASGSGAYLDDGSEQITCGRPDACVALENNRAGINGFSGSGGGAYLLGGGSLSLAHARVAGNLAANGAAVYAIGANSGAYFTSTIVTQNGGSGHSFQMEAGATLNLRGVTLADDASAQGIVALSGANAVFDTSIVYDPGAVIVTRTAATTNSVTSNCVLAHAAYVSDSGSAMVGNPLFADSAAGDYALTSNSPAIDACDATPFTTLDTDYSELPRGFDIATVPNDPGPFDLGALEHQTVLFGDGFE